NCSFKTPHSVSLILASSSTNSFTLFSSDIKSNAKSLSLTTAKNNFLLSSLKSSSLTSPSALFTSSINSSLISYAKSVLSSLKSEATFFSTASIFPLSSAFFSSALLPQPATTKTKLNINNTTNDLKPILFLIFPYTSFPYFLYFIYFIVPISKCHFTKSVLLIIVNSQNQTCFIFFYCELPTT